MDGTLDEQVNKFLNSEEEIEVNKFLEVKGWICFTLFWFFYPSIFNDIGLTYKI